MLATERKTEAAMKAELLDFLTSNFLFGDASKRPQDEESLIKAGIVDSTGILELIQFVEESFGIEIEDRETIPENLDSVANILRFVQSKYENSNQRG